MLNYLLNLERFSQVCQVAEGLINSVSDKH